MGTNVIDVLIKILTFSFICCMLWSAKWQPFCLYLKLLNTQWVSWKILLSWTSELSHISQFGFMCCILSIFHFSSRIVANINESSLIVPNSFKDFLEEHITWKWYPYLWTCFQNCAFPGCLLYIMWYPYYFSFLCPGCMVIAVCVCVRVCVRARNPGQAHAKTPHLFNLETSNSDINAKISTFGPEMYLSTVKILIDFQLDWLWSSISFSILKPYLPYLFGLTFSETVACKYQRDHRCLPIESVSVLPSPHIVHSSDRPDPWICSLWNFDIDELNKLRSRYCRYTTFR